MAEGNWVSPYEPGPWFHDVTLRLTNVRGAGQCDPPTRVLLSETIPAGWTASSIVGGGIVEGNTIRWDLDISTPVLPRPQYQVSASDGGVVSFHGEVTEPGSNVVFPILGESVAAKLSSLAPISDFGSIQHWLLLGPFTRSVGGANPGDAEIARDYLTDGIVSQNDTRPGAGDTIVPDYGGASASTGLAPDALSRNPDGVPTWLEWRDYDDADDRIDFETAYGDLNDVMCHALTYLVVEEETVVHLGVSSDGSVQLLLDGVEIHHNAVERDAVARAYQDTPATHPGLGGITLSPGGHVLLVKVFEGEGAHNFRIGFLDESGVEIPGGPAGVEVTLDPEVLAPPPRFRRGDKNGDGEVNISDAIGVTNFLFLGFGSIPCDDAADADDNGAVNITDSVRILNVLFLGIGTIGPPGIDGCGIDPTDDPLGCAVPGC
jgi:hypothetical protein